MDQQSQHDSVHRAIIERFPMYREDPAFESWIVEHTSGDADSIAALLGRLAEHGLISDDGVVDAEYRRVPFAESEDAGATEALRSFDGATLEVLRAASVQGSTFVASLTAHAAGIGQDGALDRALQPAIERGIIVDDGVDPSLGADDHRYRFEPAALSRAIYEQIPGDERAQMHASIVKYLTEHRAEARDPGKVEMVAQMIEEHNRRASRPGGLG